MDFGIQGKIALVTGGSYGIGLAIARSLYAEGCRIALCARGETRLHEAAQLLPGCLPIPCDVRKPEDITRTIEAVIKQWGGLDILVNNVGGAGGRELRPVEELPDSQWLEAFQRNACAATRFTMQAIPGMKRSGWGRVVTIASTKGKEGGGRPWYTMSKSAQIALMKTLALDKGLVRAGITFNSVAPGRVIFPGNEWDQFRAEAPQRFAQTLDQRLPLGRAGTPEEVAAAVAFLCSRQASLINGACLAVDGGESFSF
jgi:3-oxoacyl-[acyl-carrier protein] reductase